MHRFPPHFCYTRPFPRHTTHISHRSDTTSHHTAHTSHHTHVASHALHTTHASHGARVSCFTGRKTWHRTALTSHRITSHRTSVAPFRQCIAWQRTALHSTESPRLYCISHLADLTPQVMRMIKREIAPVIAENVLGTFGSKAKSIDVMMMNGLSVTWYYIYR